MEKNDQKPRSKYGRRFDEEFKRDAVSMLESRVRTAEQLAGEPGLSAWSLKRWAKLYAQDSAALVLENARSRRELETVSRQPGIAASYEVITKMKTEQSCYSVAEMGLALGVSRSGLYDHMGSKVFRKPLRLFSRRPRFRPAVCI